MNVPPAQFKDYGDLGDSTGARRARRSFRLCVASAIFLTGMLWFAENFLRYDQAERLYQRALTLNPDSSARVFLHKAIEVDAWNNERATPRYTQALAVRQGDHTDLATYRQAVKLDPEDSFFRIRYGCRLFVNDRWSEASREFREAAALPPPNALPVYLNAAARARGVKREFALTSSSAVMANANKTEDRVLFPRPFWSSDLPQSGRQYAYLSRRIQDQCLAPLYALSYAAVQQVEGNMARSNPEQVRALGRELARMGERLVFDAEPEGSLPAMAGVHIQLQALRLRRLGTSASDDVQWTAHEEALLDAQSRLAAFEQMREPRIEAESAAYVYPLKLVAVGVAGLVLFYVMAFSVCRLLRPSQFQRTIVQSPFAHVAATLVMFTLLLFLTVYGLRLRYAGPPASGYHPALTLAWSGILVVAVLFAIFYPAIVLPRPRRAAFNAVGPEKINDILSAAGRAYRNAYVTLVYRYAGLLFGLYACMVCVWIVSHRVLHGLYPDQVNLLVSGLLNEEREVVREVRRLLSYAGERP